MLWRRRAACAAGRLCAARRGRHPAGGLGRGCAGVAGLSRPSAGAALVQPRSPGLSALAVSRCRLPRSARRHAAPRARRGRLWLAGWASSPPASAARRRRRAVRALRRARRCIRRLARYRDFYWSTLARLRRRHSPGRAGARPRCTRCSSSGVRARRTSGRRAGFSSRRRRPSRSRCWSAASWRSLGRLPGRRARRGGCPCPRRRIGVLYFGLPVPDLSHADQPGARRSSSSLGYRLREVMYVAGLLGRPELGYWLVFAGAGADAGARHHHRLRRHRQRPAGSAHWLRALRRPPARARSSARGCCWATLAVLMFGIVPPLIIFGDPPRGGGGGRAHPHPRAGTGGSARGRRGAAPSSSCKEQTPTAMMTALSVGGVGVGVMALIIVLSVMSGFEADLQQKILGTNAHAVVIKYARRDRRVPRGDGEDRRCPGVVGQTPFIINEVMIASEGNIAGVDHQGHRPETVGTVTDLPKNILPGGALEYLAHPEQIRVTAPIGARARSTPPGSRGRGTPRTKRPRTTPSSASRRSGEGSAGAARHPARPRAGRSLGRGRRPGERRLAARRRARAPGPMPKSRPFRVAGIFYSGMYEYDSKFVYILLDEAQKLLQRRRARPASS